MSKTTKATSHKAKVRSRVHAVVYPQHLPTRKSQAGGASAAQSQSAGSLFTPGKQRRQPHEQNQRGKQRPRCFFESKGPTVIFVPVTSSDSSGNTVPRKTTKVMAKRAHFAKRKPTRATETFQLMLRFQRIQPLKQQPQRGNEGDADEYEEDRSQSRLAKRVDRADNAGAGNKGAKERKGIGENDEETLHALAFPASRSSLPNAGKQFR